MNLLLGVLLIHQHHNFHNASRLVPSLRCHHHCQGKVYTRYRHCQNRTNTPGICNQFITITFVAIESNYQQKALPTNIIITTARSPATEFTHHYRYRHCHHITTHIYTAAITTRWPNSSTFIMRFLATLAPCT